MTSVDVGLVDGDLPAFCRHITGDALTAQRLRLRLLQYSGDWLLDRAAGVPWLDWTQAKPPPLAEIEATLRREIETTPGVRRVDELRAAWDATARRVTVTATAVLDDGGRARVTTASDRGGNASPWSSVAVGLF